jgi:hypothetical protein
LSAGLEAAEAAALRIGLVLGHAAIVFRFRASQASCIDTGRKVRSHLRQLEARIRRRLRSGSRTRIRAGSHRAWFDARMAEVGGDFPVSDAGG